MRKTLDNVSTHLWKTINDVVANSKDSKDVYTVGVFGSARTQPDHQEYKDVYNMASWFAYKGVHVLTGGGPGLMCAANKGGKQFGMQSTGIGITLPFEPCKNDYCSPYIEHASFHTRLQNIFAQCNAYVVCGGGIGTALELMMALQLKQVGHIPADTPIVAVGCKWWFIRSLVDCMTNDGYCSEEDKNLLKCVDTYEEAYEEIMKHYGEWKK